MGGDEEDEGGEETENQKRKRKKETQKKTERKRDKRKKKQKKQEEKVRKQKPSQRIRGVKNNQEDRRLGALTKSYIFAAGHVTVTGRAEHSTTTTKDRTLQVSQSCEGKRTHAANPSQARRLLAWACVFDILKHRLVLTIAERPHSGVQTPAFKPLARAM